MPQGRAPPATSASQDPGDLRGRHVQHVSGAAHLAGSHRAQRDAGHAALHVREARQVVGGGHPECRRGARTVDGDERDRFGRRHELDVVRHQQRVQRLQEVVARAHVDVEQQAVRERGDAHVGRDAALDGQQQRRAAAPGHERGDVVRQHPLEKRGAIRSRDLHRDPEAQIEHRGRARERGVLRLRITEVTRQRHAAVVGVYRTACRQVRMQSGLGHRTVTVPAPTPLDKWRTRADDRSSATYEDILAETRDGVAWITINRPELRNAFRPETLDQMIDAFNRCRDDDIGVVILTGAGDKAFCSGGDQRVRGHGGT